MLARLLRVAAVVAYGVLLCVAFAAAAYTSFSLFVRSGVTQVPHLVGLTRLEAESLLADQGLRLRHAAGADRFHDEVPPGRVLEQIPASRTLVKRGSEVEVLLSLGPHRVAVPDLAGLGLPSAQVALAAAGLNLGRVLRIYSQHGDPGTVIEQDPPPGSLTAPSQPVDLLLCLDNPTGTYVMPDLIYRRHEEVRRFFDGLGFRFGSVKFERYEGIPEGVILRQFPLAGHPVRRTDAISLVVATVEAATR